MIEDHYFDNIENDILVQKNFYIKDYRKYFVYNIYIIVYYVKIKKFC